MFTYGYLKVLCLGASRMQRSTVCLLKEYLVFFSASTSSKSEEANTASLAEKLAEEFTKSDIYKTNSVELTEIFNNRSKYRIRQVQAIPTVHLIK